MSARPEFLAPEQPGGKPRLVIARTKWQILNERRTRLAEELAKLDATIDGLARTNCGLKCSGCGQWLASEREFAEHFVIPDERYLNLGDCPVVDR